MPIPADARPSLIQRLEDLSWDLAKTLITALFLYAGAVATGIVHRLPASVVVAAIGPLVSIAALRAFRWLGQSNWYGWKAAAFAALLLVSLLAGLMAPIGVLINAVTIPGRSG